MTIETNCPFHYNNILCILGNRYKQVKVLPKYTLPQDLPNLLYVGKCVCCVKHRGDEQ